MTNRYLNPNSQYFADPVTGAPLSGGKLYFYASGTSTPLDTYSEITLTTPNSNPVVLDSNGYANNIFLQNLAYKVILTDSNDVQQWTMDPVSTSDYTTFAQVKPWSGNPNGQVAGIASTQGSLPGSSMIWDYVNRVLYVCTTTGNAVTTVWTAVNPANAATVTPQPTGRLTPTSGTPVLSTDVVNNTSLVYTPYVGNTVPIYSGTAMTNQTFTEITLTLTASQAANTLYDVFIFNNSGVLTLVTGPAWSVSTAGSGARGSGAGTAQISRISGIWTNTVQITGRNGATTYTIAAGLATYLGTISIGSVAGQISCYVTYGQSRRWDIWNAYNRVPIQLLCGDATASWADSGAATWRNSNGSTNNKLTTLCGLAEEVINATFIQNVTSNGAGRGWQIGIGLNWSAGAPTGLIGTASSLNNGSIITTVSSQQIAPMLGINTMACLESATVPPLTFLGTNTNMIMNARWLG